MCDAAIEFHNGAFDDPPFLGMEGLELDKPGFASRQRRVPNGNIGGQHLR